ncbi:MAG: 50S ribosomal protein L22 [Candidatus Zambryskibacteria bacterium]|nr:50S ribosomal protein L22 [Candidatus Zambryskibacteria bacterium]
MPEIKAELKNYRQSPRKVRVVADTVRGKRVEEALILLDFIPKRSSLPLKKLIASAYANGGKNDNLFIKEIQVNAGPTLYRRQPRSRGMANPIRKRTSRVSVILAEGK